MCDWLTSLFLAEFQNLYHRCATGWQVFSQQNFNVNKFMWSSNLFFFASSCFPRFPQSRFFRVQVFHSPGFSESRFFRVQVFQDLGFSESSFSGCRFFRVQVQVQDVGPGFRSSLELFVLFQRERLSTQILINYLQQNSLFLNLTSDKVTG